MTYSTLLFAAFLPALASAEVTALEPMLVQGKAIDSSELAISGNISLIDESQLIASRDPSFSFQDLFASIPGAYSGNSTAGNFSLRGLNQENLFPVLGTSSNPLINVMEDGAPLSTSTLRYLPPILWDFESARVLRGPQSLGPGPNSIGGELQLKSTGPSSDWNGKALLEVAEYNTFRTGLAQDFSLIPEKLSARFSYFHQETDGQSENITLDDDEFAAVSRDRYQFQLGWKPSPNQSDLVSLSVIQESSRGNPNALVQELPGRDFFDRKTALNTRSSYPADRWAATLNTRFELPRDLELGTTSSFQRSNLNSLLDFDSTPILRWFVNGATDEKRFTQDFHIAKRQGAFQWQVGTYFEHSDYDVDLTGEGVVPALPPPLFTVFGTPFTSVVSENVEIAALYGRFDYEFARSWHAKGGMRLNHEDREVHTSSKISVLPPKVNHEKISSNELLPEIAIAWLPDDANETGLRLARGARSGGVSNAAGLGVTQAYAPEYNWELELYSRNRITDQFEISGGIFHSWMEDQQVSYNAPGGFPGIDRLTTNAATSRRYGAELETRWQPVEGLSLHGTTGWTHTEFRSLKIGVTDRSGQDFPNAPEWTASLGADYLHSSGVFGSILYSWADSTYNDPSSPSLTQMETRSLLSARMGYQWNNASVYVFGTNLLNDEFAVSRIDNTGLGLPVGGKIAPPRIFGIGCEARW